MVSPAPGSDPSPNEVGLGPVRNNFTPSYMLRKSGYSLIKVFTRNSFLTMRAFLDSDDISFYVIFSIFFSHFYLVLF